MRARYAASIVVIFWLASAAPAGAADTETYTSPDGSLSFNYPASWSLSTEWPSYLSVTSPIKTQTNGHLENGEAKVEVYIESDASFRTLDDLEEEYCRSNQELDETVYECGIQRFNGRSWIWKYALEHSLGGVWVRVVATIANDKVYAIQTIVPDGQSKSESLAVTRSVVASAFVNEVGLAATGFGAVPAVALGLGLMVAGSCLRIGRRAAGPRATC